MQACALVLDRYVSLRMIALAYHILVQAALH